MTSSVVSLLGHLPNGIQHGVFWQAQPCHLFASLGQDFFKLDLSQEFVE